MNLKCVIASLNCRLMFTGRMHPKPLLSLPRVSSESAISIALTSSSKSLIGNRQLIHFKVFLGKKTWDDNLWIQVLIFSFIDKTWVLEFEEVIGEHVVFWESIGYGVTGLSLKPTQLLIHCQEH